MKSDKKLGYFIEGQMKYKEKTIMFFTILVTTILGLINILINHSTAQSIVDTDKTSMVWVYLGIPISAITIEIFYSFAFALVSYFVAAAMQKGFDIKLFYKLGYRVLVALPLITLADMIGFLILGQKFSELGILGMLSYIPFYFGIFINTYYITPKYIELNKKQSFAMSVILTIIMAFVSYPYNG